MKTKTICGSNIVDFTVSSNGYQGGDAGHGGFTEIGIKDVAGTDMNISLLSKGDNIILSGEVPISEIKILFRGDSERKSLIKGLTFILNQLKK